MMMHRLLSLAHALIILVIFVTIGAFLNSSSFSSLSNLRARLSADAPASTMTTTTPLATIENEPIPAQTAAASPENTLPLSFSFDFETPRDGVLTENHVDDVIGCDPTVKSISGYFSVGQFKHKRYFFWFFESRNKPKEDNTLMFINGGPGCSSELALFTELGPCTLTSANSTKRNPYSWNSRANLLFVDQPADTGYSYGGRLDRNEKQVGEDMYAFLTAFFAKYEEYAHAGLYLFGESYAGHYVPAIAAAVHQGNKRPGARRRLNLRGIGIGNGLTNPAVQYPFYPEMAMQRKSVSQEVYAQMKADVAPCVGLIRQCNLSPPAFPVTNPACMSALQFCNERLIGPYQRGGWNVYDNRLKCAVPPLCYDFSNLEKFLNRPEVKRQLGVPPTKRWQECNNVVHAAMEGDWMHDWSFLIGPMLDDGIGVLIYAGMNDYICNYLGNRAMAAALKWSGSQGFASAKETSWEKDKGTMKAFGGLVYLGIKEAGHMAPMDQPAVTLKMVDWFFARTAKSGGGETGNVDGGMRVEIA